MRQKKKSRIGVDYKGIGEVPLALEVLAGDLQTQHMTKPLQRCNIEGASVTLAITARYLNDVMACSHIYRCLILLLLDWNGRDNVGDVRIL